MDNKVRWAFMALWFIVAALLWAVWDIVRHEILTPLVMNLSSPSEAKAVAAKYALVAGVIKYVVMFGPLYLIWSYKGKRPGAPAISPLPEQVVRPSTFRGSLVGAAAGVASFVLVAVLTGNDPKSLVIFDYGTLGFFVITGAIVGAVALRE